MKAYNVYSTVMFDPRLLRAVVAHLAKVLPALMQEHDFDTIAVRGKSGMAVGFALSMVTGINIVVVRKGESSHGDMVEGGGHEFSRYCFLDDFECTGATKHAVQSELAAYAKARGQDEPECVYTIEYSKYSVESNMRSRSYDSCYIVGSAGELADCPQLLLSGSS